VESKKERTHWNADYEGENTPGRVFSLYHDVPPRRAQRVGEESARSSKQYVKEGELRPTQMRCDLPDLF
jgi:hypothetical protein